MPESIERRGGDTIVYLKSGFEPGTKADHTMVKIINADGSIEFALHTGPAKRDDHVTDIDDDTDIDGHLNDECELRRHSSVDFEHPAEGVDHCSQCKHFRGVNDCELVCAPVTPEDWCKLFEAGNAQAQDVAMDEIPPELIRLLAGQIIALDRRLASLRPKPRWSLPKFPAMDEFHEEQHKRNHGKFAKQAGAAGGVSGVPSKPGEKREAAKPPLRAYGRSNGKPGGQPGGEANRYTNASVSAEPPDKAGTHGTHPGHGYSNEARVRNGKIHTSNVNDAVRALWEGRKVVLDQPRQVSTLVSKLSGIARRAEKLGGKVPNFDLCNVSVANTNLFCAETKGIPRVKMPQLPDEKGPQFQKFLQDKGFKTTEGEEPAAYLKATQSELVGAKVSGIMGFFRDRDPSQDPPLFVSRDNYIVDGHHRWAARVGLDAENNQLGQTKVKVVKVDLPIIELLAEAESFTEGKGHKAATAHDRALRKLAADHGLAMDRATFEWQPLASEIGQPIAMDRAPSSRIVTEDGHMHITANRISKADVNPYWGEEIPGFDKLGLDPKKKYMLLRHPDELAKAAASFNNKPILAEHIPVSAAKHPADLVIGSTGSDTRYEHPFLKSSLVFWPQPAIDAINSEGQKELSCAYHYDPDMRPGVYEGKRFDGVMRNIRGNHVALVKDGRAGSEVVVQDKAFDPNKHRWSSLKWVSNRR